MNDRILVINPNSNSGVTAAIDCALDPLRSSDAPQIDCITVAEGPYGIESQGDVDAAAPLVCRSIEAQLADAGAFVIACYSDPGLRAARELTDKPIFGIAETGLATALMLGSRPGIISILDIAVARHWAYARSLGLAERIAADVAIDMRVAELANEAPAAEALLAAGRRLCNEHGADVILLGCAGMARYRAALESELQRVVIDPTQAAVAAAITALRLGYRTARQGNRSA